jgi:hypothetical protein
MEGHNGRLNSLLAYGLLLGKCGSITISLFMAQLQQKQHLGKLLTSTKKSRLIMPHTTTIQPMFYLGISIYLHNVTYNKECLCHTCHVGFAP